MVDEWVLNGDILSDSFPDVIDAYEIERGISSVSSSWFMPEDFTTELIASSVTQANINGFAPGLKNSKIEYRISLLRGAVRYSNKFLFVYMISNAIIGVHDVDVNSLLVLSFDTLIASKQGVTVDAQYIFAILLKHPHVTRFSVRVVLEHAILMPPSCMEVYFGPVRNHRFCDDDLIDMVSDRICEGVMSNENNPITVIDRCGKWHLNPILKKLTAIIFERMNENIDFADQYTMRVWASIVSTLVKHYTLDTITSILNLETLCDRYTINLIFVKAARYANFGILQYIGNNCISKYNTEDQRVEVCHLAMNVCVSPSDTSKIYHTNETALIIRYIVDMTPKIVDAPGIVDSFIGLSYMKSRGTIFAILFGDPSLTGLGIQNLLRVVVECMNNEDVIRKRYHISIMIECLHKMPLDKFTLRDIGKTVRREDVIISFEKAYATAESEVFHTNVTFLINHHLQK